MSKKKASKKASKKAPKKKAKKVTKNKSPAPKLSDDFKDFSEDAPDMEKKPHELIALSKAYEDITKLVSSIRGRDSHLQINEDFEVAEWEQKYKFNMELQKKYLVKAMHKALNTVPIWSEWGVNVIGFGDANAGILIGKILSMTNPLTGKSGIAAFNHPSALLKFVGLGVTDGFADDRRKGEKLSYCGLLKSRLWLLSEQFVRNKANPKNYYYGYFYDMYKRKTVQKHCVVADGEIVNPPKDRWEKVNNKLREPSDQWSKGHVHNHVCRMMRKMFICHMYEVWRKLEGLEAVPYYIFDHPEKDEKTGLPKHYDYYPAPSFDTDGKPIVIDSKAS